MGVLFGSALCTRLNLFLSRWSLSLFFLSIVFKLLFLCSQGSDGRDISDLDKIGVSEDAAHANFDIAKSSMSHGLLKLAEAFHITVSKWILDVTDQRMILAQLNVIFDQLLHA